MAHKTAVNAYLNDEEVNIIKEAQDKYITEGKGNASIRTILLMGAKEILKNA
jgi:hypothetical protein